ncbi:hypothetical protein JTB14_002182 [Gonioctena quinquepunctata]|nr:hypothetical protein JTB14_002182 [Gonioctena quinquepunctata]
MRACRSVVQAAIVNERKYPAASEVIKNCFYVDDLICGAPSIGEAIILKDQINQIFLESKFTLRKWTSNKAEIVIDENSHHSDDTYVSPGNENIITLGLVWNPNDDALMYNTTLTQSSIVTKRCMLSTEFLMMDAYNWPESKFEIPEEIPDVYREVLCVCKEQKIALHSYNPNPILYSDQSIFDKFSTFTKLHQVFTYVLRFLHNINPKNKNLTETLTKHKLNESLKLLLKMSQSKQFHHEIQALNSRKMI